MGLTARKKYFLLAGKVALAAGLIAWITFSGRLDFAKIWQTQEHSWFLIAGFSLTCLLVFLSFIRWRILLQGQGIFLTLRDTIRLCLIGNFFSTFIPGAVGGDIVKAYYTARLKKGQTTGVVLSIGADRALALFSLCLVTVVAGFFYWERIETTALSHVVRLVGWGIFGALVGISLIYVLLKKLQVGKAWQFADHPWGSLIASVLQFLTNLRHNWRAGLAALAVSLVICLLLGTCFYSFARSLGETQTPWSIYFFAGPLIVLAMAVPVTPAGIGIGQIAALAIFSRLKAGDLSFGADLVTLLHLSRIIIGLCGAYIYIKYRNKVSKQCPNTHINNFMHTV